MNTSHLKKNIPAHIVVNRVGLLTGKKHFFGINIMKQLLENEGMIIDNNQIKNFTVMEFIKGIKKYWTKANWNVNKKNFPNLEIDARLTIFSNSYANEYNILNKELTHYNYDQNGITAKIKKYSKTWWLRRSEAFSYLKIIMNKNKSLFIYSFDYYLTNILAFLIKKKL